MPRRMHRVKSLILLVAVVIASLAFTVFAATGAFGCTPEERLLYCGPDLPGSRACGVCGGV